MAVLSKLDKIDPKLESNVSVEEPRIDAISLPETEQQKSMDQHALTFTEIPLDMVEYILKNLHPLEKFCCYEVSPGMRLTVEKSLRDPETLGIYLSDKSCVVYSDGKYCKYTMESGGCGYGYGTYGRKNKYGHYADHKIPFERKKRIGFLQNVKYEKAGLNVFLSVLTKHGNYLEKLTICVKDRFNPNKLIMSIDKKLISLNTSLSVERVDLFCMTPKQMMKIISHLKPTLLSGIQLRTNSGGEEDNETMKKIARTEQWRNADSIRTYFPTSIPIRKYFHLQSFHFERNKMSVREIVNLRNSIFKHQHIEEVEVTIHDPTFDIGICRRALGPCILDPTDPEVGFYQGPNGFINVCMGRAVHGRIDISLIRWSELPVFQ